MHVVCLIIFSAPLVTIRAMPFCYNDGRVYVDGVDVGESNGLDLIYGTGPNIPGWWLWNVQTLVGSTWLRVGINFR